MKCFKNIHLIMLVRRVRDHIWLPADSALTGRPGNGQKNAAAPPAVTTTHFPLCMCVCYFPAVETNVHLSSVQDITDRGKGRPHPGGGEAAQTGHVKPDLMMCE